MQDNNNEQQKFIKSLLTVAPKHCDNCGNRYSENDFRIVKTTNSSIVLHLRCSNCNNTYMLNVMNPINGIVGAQRVPLNLDLLDQEIQKFAGKEAVSNNDALDIYDTLKKVSTADDLKRFLV